MGRRSERPYRVCQFEVPLCSRAWGRGAASTAPTHGAQTKQQDECFLNPTWQGGTPICPFGLTDWLSESTEENIRQVIGEVHERTRERSSLCSLSNFPPWKWYLSDNSSWLHIGSYFHTLVFYCNSRGCTLSWWLSAMNAQFSVWKSLTGQEMWALNSVALWQKP